MTNETNLLCRHALGPGCRAGCWINSAQAMEILCVSSASQLRALPRVKMRVARVGKPPFMYRASDVLFAKRLRLAAGLRVVSAMRVAAAFALDRVSL